MTNSQPTTKIVGYQSWRNLLFVHWRVDAQQIQGLLPKGLTVETFDGSAWLAVVPFAMERVRPWWSPAVPGISWFLETNVRTYVRHENGQTGVWFFSLDANQRLAVSVARRFWHLNYQFAGMKLHATNEGIAYSGKRQGSEHGYEICAEVDQSAAPQAATNDSLEHFLLERYHLFAKRPDGRFLCGQVHHEPYVYRSVTSCVVQQSLTDTAGCTISPDHKPDHVVFSAGVDVRVSPLQLIT